MSNRGAGWATPILHADLDAFYASVEMLRDPVLKGKPVIVGGTSSRGVVTSASYEARHFGVTSAMPTSRARRLCPEGIFISPDFKAYEEYSRAVQSVFESFTPVVEPLSLDEAFLDGAGAGLIWRYPSDMAVALRQRVESQTGLKVSVGIASNKFLAKLASVYAKPDGLFVVEPERAGEFLNRQPVTALWGVGERTANVLARLGLNTAGDVAKVPPETLIRVLGSLGSQVADLARGIDHRRVVSYSRRKSCGAEETFESDLTELTQMHRGILALSERVSWRLRSEGSSGREVTLKVRFSNFKTITRSKTLSFEVDGTRDIYQVAQGLLSRALGRTQPDRSRVRLLGVSVSTMAGHPASEQLSLENRPRWKKAEAATDQVKDRFGRDSVSFATLYEEPS